MLHCTKLQVYQNICQFIATMNIHTAVYIVRKQKAGEPLLLSGMDILMVHVGLSVSVKVSIKCNMVLVGKFRCCIGESTF